MTASVSIRQIRAVIAVCEESSFTRAARREFSTQSGISQRIAALERALGVKLFERSIEGVLPTEAGRCFYKRCLDAVGAIRNAIDDVRSLQQQPTNCLHVGLTPIFAATALAPTLKRFMHAYPKVMLKVLEGYSGALMEKLYADQLDVAIVTKFEERPGLRSQLLVRDREMLVSGRAHNMEPLAAVRLKEIKPLKIVSPGANNMHHRNLQSYLQTNGISIDGMIEMEGIVSTLEFVAATDWVALLPGVICRKIRRADVSVNALVDPPMHTDFMIVAPSQRPLSSEAHLFIEQFKAEMSCLDHRQGADATTKRRRAGSAARPAVKRRAQL